MLTNKINKTMVSFYNSRFVSFRYYEDERILQQTWNYTHHQNNLHFYLNVNQCLHIVDEYQVTSILIDFSNFTFCLTPEDQQKLQKNAFSKLKKSQVQKIALIKSSDKNTQETLITLFETGIEKPMINAFFNDVNEAKQWLLANKPNTGFCTQQVIKKSNDRLITNHQ